MSYQRIRFQPLNIFWHLPFTPTMNWNFYSSEVMGDVSGWRCRHMRQKCLLVSNTYERWDNISHLMSFSDFDIFLPKTVCPDYKFCSNLTGFTGIISDVCIWLKNIAYCLFLYNLFLARKTCYGERNIIPANKMDCSVIVILFLFL